MIVIDGKVFVVGLNSSSSTKPILVNAKSYMENRKTGSAWKPATEYQIKNSYPDLWEAYEAEKDGAEDLSKKTVAELKSLAEQKGVIIADTDKKADIIEKLK